MGRKGVRKDRNRGERFKKKVLRKKERREMNRSIMFKTTKQ